MSAGTVVVFHAHPDDEAIFTAATMTRLAQSGFRVVLVTATGGELGTHRIPLPRGESLGGRRRRELEQACDALGVARLVMLDYRDSGAQQWQHQPLGSFGAAPIAQVAGRLVRIAQAEDAAALVHYDRGGIYGHVDHVKVHRAGRLAADYLGVPSYEATVDPERIRRETGHLLHAASYLDTPVGVPRRYITLTLQADARELAAKRLAMCAHASQIAVEELPSGARFAAGYAREWYVRRGPAGIIDSLACSTERVLFSPSEAAVAAPVHQ